MPVKASEPSGAKDKVMVNRAPVMTLWGAVVAERLGFDADEGLSLGSAVAVLNAQAKGKRLGIFKPGEKGATRPQAAPGEEFFLEIVGRPVPVRDTDRGIRASIKGKPVVPEKVRRYLEQKFGPALPAAREAMRSVARSYKPSELADAAYPLYEQFRPAIPPGTRGWGAKGELDLQLVRSLARKPAGRAKGTGARSKPPGSEDRPDRRGGRKTDPAARARRRAGAGS